MGKPKDLRRKDKQYRIIQRVKVERESEYAVLNWEWHKITLENKNAAGV